MQPACRQYNGTLVAIAEAGLQAAVVPAESPARAIRRRSGPFGQGDGKSQVLNRRVQDRTEEHPLPFAAQRCDSTENGAGRQRSAKRLFYFF